MEYLAHKFIYRLSIPRPTGLTIELTDRAKELEKAAKLLALPSSDGL